MGQQFEVAFNLRSADIKHGVGIMALELTGEREGTEAAVK